MAIALTYIFQYLQEKGVQDKKLLFFKNKSINFKIMDLTIFKIIFLCIKPFLTINLDCQFDLQNPQIWPGVHGAALQGWPRRLTQPSPKVIREMFGPLNRASGMQTTIDDADMTAPTLLTRRPPWRGWRAGRLREWFFKKGIFGYKNLGKRAALSRKLLKLEIGQIEFRQENKFINLENI